MKNLNERMNDILNRYADLEGQEDIEEIEMLLEDAMNIINEIVNR